MPPSSQRLIYNGRLLADDTASVGAVGILPVRIATVRYVRVR